MAVGVLFMAWYANSSKRNVILCRYRRVNKTMVVKFVKMQSRYVIFDGGKFDIIPGRIIFQWYNNGFVHMLFPQWVATLDYSWNSRFPHNPNNMEITAETPQTRKALNKEEWVESYYKGAKPSSAKNGKLGFLQQWLPWIAILLVIVVAFYFNSKMQGFGATLDQVIDKINTITK
jgi:hypothetical protein